MGVLAAPALGAPDPGPGSAQIDRYDGRTHSLNALACPTARLCVAVDDNGRAATFDPRAPGSRSRARVDNAHTGALAAVACPSNRHCTAVDDVGAKVTLAPGSTAHRTPTDIDGSASFDALACSSTRRCTGVDNLGARSPSTQASRPTAVARRSTARAPGFRVSSVPRRTSARQWISTAAR